MTLQDLIGVILSSGTNAYQRIGANSIPVPGSHWIIGKEVLHIKLAEEEFNIPDLSFTTFDYEIVYTDDISITLRWGLDLDKSIVDDFTKKFPNQTATLSVLEVCHNGVAVIRKKYLGVDGGRLLLPVTTINLPGSNLPRVTAFTRKMLEIMNHFSNSQDDFDRVFDDNFGILGEVRLSETLRY